MKLFVVLAMVALSSGAKLDNTYLPPSHAPSSGGSGNFLQSPVSGSNDFQRNNGFGQSSRGPTRNGPLAGGRDYKQSGIPEAQSGNFAQSGNAFAQSGNGFAQPNNGFAQNYDLSANFGGFDGRPERAQAAFERNAAILRQDNQNDGESYAYAYETENGIVAEENGVATNGVEAQGGFSYTGDDGQVYSIRYTADQNGFVPQGDHLPTPPPIPDEILKALEQNARDEANGIYDDGSYNEAKYGGGADNGAYNNGNNNGFNGNNNGFNGNANGFNGNANDNVADDEDTVVTNSAFLRSGNLRGNGQNPSFRGQGFNQGLNTQARAQSLQGPTGNQAGASNAYLPPFQRSQAGRTGSRRPSFDARTGYRY